MAEAYGFSTLRVSRVDPLTSDSVALTFDVPPALADDFRFRPGQHLTLRRVVEGEDLRRTYSLCSSAVGGPLRVAVKRLDAGHCELKSMRTHPDHVRRGVGAALLDHATRHARDMGATRISLETGSAAFFAPARRLYERHGFVYCGPFGDYREDPNSVFMTAQPANAATTWSEVSGVENIG